MPTTPDSLQTLFVCLPCATLLRIFQLLCDSCPPEVPGTCWLAPVCKQWRDLARHVKGLRVLFHGGGEVHVASFCTWLRRRARQVVALVITGKGAADVLAVLAEAAGAAAAAGGRLPLQRLVVMDTGQMQPQVCQDTLQPLLGALPHLRHLHLSLWVDEYKATPQQVGEAAVSALASLQHATSLTSLVLDGDVFSEASGWSDLLINLPSSLCSLHWKLQNLGIQGLGYAALSGVTALTHLKLSGVYDPIPDDAFAALRQLRKLELQPTDYVISEEAPPAHKQQLVSLALVQGPHPMFPPWLDQLTHLQSLDLFNDLRAPPVSKPLLQRVPGLKELRVLLNASPKATPLSAVPACGNPWVLRHYSGLTGLQRLALVMIMAQTAPQELCALTQLKQLDIQFDGYDTCMGRPLSWARAVAQLVNLEVLRVPAELTACAPPWLNALPRLVVLDVGDITPEDDVAAAAVYISQWLVPQPGSGGCGGSSSSSSTGAHLHTEQVRVVCFSDFQSYWAPPHLQVAVAAALPVLPPNRHLFRRSWQELQECGVELWPAPVAARLQQLLAL